MRRSILFLLLALLCPQILLRAQPSVAVLLTADDLVRAGIANNKDLAAVQIRIAEAKGQLRQAGVRPSPTLDFTGDTGKPFGSDGEYQYGAGVSQQVETFGKRDKRVRIAELAVRMAEAEYQERSAQLAYAIKASYAEHLAEGLKKKLFDELIDLSEQSLKLTEARAREGDVAMLEANLLKVECSRARAQKAGAQGRMASAELEIRRLAGLRPEQSLPSADFPAHLPVELDNLKRKAIEERADLTMARANEERERAAISLAQAEAKPDITFSSGISRQSSEFDGLYGLRTNGSLSPMRESVNTLSFGVSLPLRTSRSGAGNVQAARARAAGAQLNSEYLTQSIPLEVESAYQRWRVATNSLQMLQRNVIDPSVSNLSIIRQAYQLGQLRLLDVLNEQRRLVDTQLASIDAQADAARTWAELERATGGNLQ
jgi:cobalt-zinc-cadmium efflux system outer membrane protein